MKKLMVVESPTKARTLKKYLPKGFEVLASVGHIKNLPKNKIGVDIDHGTFAPEYRMIPGKKKVLDEIIKKAKTAEVIYLAPDPDREGEAIAFHIAEEITKKVKRPKILRVQMYEITPKGMKAALENAADLNQKRYESQQARRVLDRIVGYQISPLLWEKVKVGTSAGRVQSVALRLAVEREKAIKAFVPKDYYRVFANFKCDAYTIETELVQCEGRKFMPRESDIPQETLEAKIAEFPSQKWRILDVGSKNIHKKSPTPYITSSLQMDASSRLRFSPKKTMLLAQQLYEGVELGELGTLGLITYMRTDSPRLAPEAVAAAKDYIHLTWGDRYAGGGKTGGGGKSSAKHVQGAHEAIRPADVTLTPEKIKGHLARDQLSLYTLIWKRFVASQMAEAVFKQWQVRFANASEKDVFSHSKQQVVFDGFRVLWSEDEDNESAQIPYQEISSDTAADYVEGKMTAHKTEPPPRFTEASLIKELEHRGIGRPSTYASIMSTIIDRQYVEKTQAKLIPTSLGTVISDLLSEHFQNIMNYDFTATMEDSLDKIEDGKSNRKKVLNSFYAEFKATLQKAKKEMKNLKTQEIPTDIPCDTCGAMMNVRWGKTGEFLSCSQYPKCRNAANFSRDEDGIIHIIKPPVFSGKSCPACGKALTVRFGRYGRYLACENYPTCNTTLPYPVGVKCPECKKGDIVERKSKRGAVFYSCDQYPACKFASWQKPVPRPCSACGHPYMVEKETKKLGHHYACPKCKFTQPVESSDPPDNAGTGPNDDVA